MFQRYRFFSIFIHAFLPLATTRFRTISAEVSMRVKPQIGWTTQVGWSFRATGSFDLPERFHSALFYVWLDWAEFRSSISIRRKFSHLFSCSVEMELPAHTFLLYLENWNAFCSKDIIKITDYRHWQDFKTLHTYNYLLAIIIFVGAGSTLK